MKTFDEIEAAEYLWFWQVEGTKCLLLFAVKHNGIVSLNLVKLVENEALTEKEINVYIVQGNGKVLQVDTAYRVKQKVFFLLFQGVFPM